VDTGSGMVGRAGCVSIIVPSGSCVTESGGWVGVCVVGGCVGDCVVGSVVVGVVGSVVGGVVGGWVVGCGVGCVVCGVDAATSVCGWVGGSVGGGVGSVGGCVVVGGGGGGGVSAAPLFLFPKQAVSESAIKSATASVIIFVVLDFVIINIPFTKRPICGAWL